MTEPDESPSGFGTQRPDREAPPTDFWANERTGLARLLVGHVVLWTAVLIAVQLPIHSAVELGKIAVSTQIVVMSVGLAVAVVVSARSRARACIGAALALAVPVVRALVMLPFDVIAGTVGFYGLEAIVVTLIVTGVTLATAGWLVARRKRRQCLWALPVAAVLALLEYLVIDSDTLAISLGWTNCLIRLGFTVYVIPVVVSAWLAVALDRRFGQATSSAPLGPRGR